MLKSFFSFLHFFHRYFVLKNYFGRVLKAKFGHYYVADQTFMCVCSTVLNFVIVRKIPESPFLYFDVILST